MMEFTKERLERVINLNDIYDPELTKAMARQLLAGMEQEPVYQACKEAGVWVDIEPDDVDSLKANGEQVREVYAAPQLPQPAVMPHLVSAVKGELTFIDHFERIICERDGDIDIGQLGRGNYDALMLAALDAFRAAMLQGDEPVSQPSTLRDGLAAIRNLGPIDAEKIQAERDALNEPDVPDGYALVPVDPTAEMIEATFAGEMELQSVQHQMRNRERRAHYYRAMLAAAPQQEVKP